MRSWLKLLYALPLVLLVARPAAAFADACSNLASAQISGATITATTSIPAGSFTSPQQLGYQSETYTVPAFCRVQLILNPAIMTEVWLPATWNGSLAGLGDGGELGAIIYSSLAYAVDEGYAGVSSDLGHESYGADASWALNQPGLIDEFGYSATHDMTVAAKSLIQIYYGTTPTMSLFYGGSAGGRQGLMEAQQYPADYNGIVSLSPAQNWTHITSGMIEQQLNIGPAELSAAQATALNAAVVAACDGNDGVIDGIITDPTKCVFDPGTLQCSPNRAPGDGGSPTCLTAGQVAAVRALYAPVTFKNGKIVYNGLPPGSEYEWTCSVLNGAFNFPFANSWYQNEVFSNPRWNYQSFNIDKDVHRADKLLANTLNASSPNLDAFKAAGGKLLISQGQADAIVVPLNTIGYYKSVLARYSKATGNFVRLFMEPGVGHCGSPTPGPGAWDPLVALSAWVRTGLAPDSITAYRVDQSGQITMSRPLCPYPKQAIYLGQGDVDDAKNFKCGKAK
jgi:feruloyl esterase